MREQDILIKPKRVPFNVSIYVNGRWYYDSLQNPVRNYEGQNYYRMNYSFGLVYEDVEDPSKTCARGSAGDYVTESSDGTLGILSRADYTRLFPTLNKLSEPIPPTSSLLRNHNYITNVLAGNTQPTYNSVPQRSTVSRSSANTSPNTITSAPPKPCNCN